MVNKTKNNNSKHKIRFDLVIFGILLYILGILTGAILGVGIVDGKISFDSFQRDSSDNDFTVDIINESNEIKQVKNSDIRTMRRSEEIIDGIVVNENIDNSDNLQKEDSIQEEIEHILDQEDSDSTKKSIPTNFVD